MKVNYLSSKLSVSLILTCASVFQEPTWGTGGGGSHAGADAHRQALAPAQANHRDDEDPAERMVCLKKELERQIQALNLGSFKNQSNDDKEDPAERMVRIKKELERQIQALNLGSFQNQSNYNTEDKAERMVRLKEEKEFQRALKESAAYAQEEAHRLKIKEEEELQRALAESTNPKYYKGGYDYGFEEAKEEEKQSSWQNPASQQPVVQKHQPVIQQALSQDQKYRQADFERLDTNSKQRLQNSLTELWKQEQDGQTMLKKGKAEGESYIQVSRKEIDRLLRTQQNQ
jgi:hypothetical protein